MLATTSLKKGVAPIKSEFLVRKSETAVDVATALSAPSEPQATETKSDSNEPNALTKDTAGNNDLTDSSGNAKSEKRPADSGTGYTLKHPPGKRRKGQNKNREKFSNHRPAIADRLCKAIICDTGCGYGDKCKFSHDIDGFMAKKPADIGEVCYNFKNFGRCPYGFACRYGQSHITQENGKYKNIVDDSVIPESKSLNSLDRDVKTKLMKRKYDFKKSDAAFKEAQSFVGKIVQRNEQLNCSKKPGSNRSGNASSVSNNGHISADSEKPKADNVKVPGEAVDNAAVPAAPASTESKSEEIETLSAASKQEGNSNDPETKTEAAEMVTEGKSVVETVESTVTEDKPVGPVTNEDQFTIKPSEKKTINFKNKLYLAPLTTVGNLPFRRVCKNYGVDITCGEMALATKLLQGVNTEWALVKRHSSEDLFGVQVAGAFPDSMARCAQLLSETCDIDFIDINVGCPIDMIFDMGAGSALMRRLNRFHEIVRSMVAVSSVPITVKIRTGISETKATAHTLIPKLKTWDVALTTLHGRSREQRYTKNADWVYIDECAKISDPMPLFGGGDILSYEDYNAAMETDVKGVMLARGALIKPWVFTEIKEQRHWDISSSERLDILRDFSNYGLEHWGSDQQGVETTRRFMLEWLSFLHRYIPVGLLERLPQKINERPSPYFGRDDLETLMASPNCADWVKISEMLLGPVPEGFFFIPKHRANSWS